MDILSILADVAVPSSRIVMSSPTVSSSAWDGLTALSAIGSMFSNLFSLAAAVLVIIGTWKILEKAGEQGWKSLIPYYNSYTLYKVFWQTKWFFLSLIPAVAMVIGFVGAIIPLIGIISLVNTHTSADESMYTVILIICGLIIVASMICSFIFKVAINVKIAKAFGKSEGFAVGLTLLAPVFYMILGCGKDKYVKSEENKEAKPTETESAE